MASLQKYCSICLLILIAAVYALMSFWTPTGLDDWMFMGEWNNVTAGKGFSFSSLYDFWATIRQGDNGRLSNTLIPVFLIYSPFRELFPIVTGLFVALIIWIETRLAFNKHLTPFFFLLSWSAVIFLLPWRNNLFVADYSINYIWTAGITLLFMLLVMREEKRGWTLPWFIGAMFMALIAGLWHEGFALATLGGFLLYSLIAKKKFSIQWWTIGCFYAIVAVANYLCPGMLLRTGNELASLSPGTSWMSLAVDFMPVLLLVILLVGFLLFSAGRKRIHECCRNSWFIIASGIVIAGTLLSLLFVHQPRSAFWPDLMAIVMFFILTNPIWVRIYSSFFKYFIILLLLCLVAMTMGFALTEQYAYHQEAKLIIEEMGESSSGTVYYDLKTPSANTAVALKVPTHDLWVTSYTYEALQNFNRKPFPAVVPAVLGAQNWRDALIALPSDPDWYRVGEDFVGPFAAANGPGVVTLSLTLNSGEEIEAAGMILPFISPDGLPLAYLKIYGVAAPEIKGFQILP